MNSTRVYRRLLSQSAIREELVNGRSSQFDPDLLDKFLELFDSGVFEATTIVNTVSAVPAK